MSKKQVAGYILDKKIGKGSYATVWKGHVESGDEVVAVKVISRQTVTETSQLRQEVEVLRRISHTNIVRFRDLKKSASHFYLVLEFCAGGDLSQFLRERGKVAEEKARKFLTQIAAGICMLHRENVLHRDLKPQNILLSSSGEDPILKIADFGFARALQPQDMAATVCGSPLYMAPEILRHQPYDGKADLWSVGAILYELLLGRPPFSGANPMQLLANIEKSEGVSFDGAQVSSDGQDFLRALLMKNPAQRLASVEFAKHTYVRLGPLSDSKQGAAKEAEGVVYANDGSSLMVKGEWCVPPPGAERSTGTGSPTSGRSSPLVVSPLCNSPRDDSPTGTGSFHLNIQFDANPALAAAAGEAHTAKTTQVMEPTAAAEVTRKTGLRSGAAWQTSAQDEQAPRVEEEYVVLTEQGPPISALAKARHASSGGGADFCGNLVRIAYALEELALTTAVQFPSDGLALLLRSLELLEKALKLSIGAEETCEPLRQAFRRIFEAAEATALKIQPTSPSPRRGGEAAHEPARPNHVIFEFAVQQAKDAAVALSKGHEVGGWEAFCYEKLTLALLLLDLLGSEAEGEDIAELSSYTAPITKIIDEIERLDRAKGNKQQRTESAQENTPASLIVA